MKNARPSTTSTLSKLSTPPAHPVGWRAHRVGTAALFEHVCAQSWYEARSIALVLLRGGRDVLEPTHVVCTLVGAAA